MDRIWHILTSRQLLALLGLVALVALLLLSARSLQVGLGRALLFVALVLLGWFGLARWRQREARRASAALGTMIEHEAAREVADAGPAWPHETAALRQRLIEAVRTIRQSRLGETSGRTALYELPWYMVIGNPAAGKSSAITNSGLQFPFADSGGRIVQGIGGTRNCDWFFTTEGIFLDTAGRYAVQDEDRREWLAFLGLLKRHRAKAPINGIVVAASVSELLQRGPDFAIDLAKQLRQRLQELTAELGVFAPVYLVFTKIDLIGDFTEFFGDADDAERARVWGATLPYDADGRANALERFDQHFDRLYTGLRELSLSVMAQRRHTRSGIGALAFPLEFAALKTPLRSFVATLFQDNPFQHRPIFRGFYFTSALQDGAATSSSTQRVAERFGLAARTAASAVASPPAQNGYFLRDLFSRVIFADRDLVRQYARPAAMRLREASMLGGAAGLGLLLAAIGWSYLGNRQLVANTVADLELSARVQDGRVDLASRLQALAVLQDRLEQLQHQRRHPPLSLGFGLYQGDRLEAKLRSEYFAGIREILLRPVTDSLEDFLREVNLSAASLQPSTPADSGAPGPVDGSTARPSAPPTDAASVAGTPYEALSPHKVDDAYAALKTYLMLGDREHLESGHLNDQLARIWRDWLERNRGSLPREDMIRSAERILSYFVAQAGEVDFPLIEHKLALIDTTRGVLRRVVSGTPARDRVYADIRARATARFPLLTVAGILADGDRGLLAGSHAIPGAFTRAAWDGYVRSAIRDAANHELQSTDWVLQSNLREDLTLEGSPEQIEAALLRSYKDDYIREWQQFMQGIAIRDFERFDDAVAGMNRLGDPADSPIRQLLTRVHEETSWDNPSPLIAAGTRSGQGLLQWLRTLVSGRSNLAAASVGDAGAAGRESARGPVGEAFAAVAALVSSRASDHASLLDAYLEALSKLRTRYNQIRNAGDPGPPSRQLMQQTLEGSGSELADALKYVDENLMPGMSDEARKTLRPLLVRPLVQAWQATVAPTEAELNKRWTAEVYAPFGRMLGGKYPFDPTSRIEATPSEISQIFGPGGTIAKFMQDAVGPLVLRRGDQIAARTWADIGIRLTPAFVAGLPTYLAASGESGAVAATAQTVFQIRPVPAPGLTEYTVDIDGQVLRYRNTPADWADFVWPAPNGRPGARISGVTNDGRTIEITNNPGRYGLEKLIGSAQRERHADGSFTLGWRSGDVHVAIELRIISSPQTAVASSAQGSGLRGLVLPATIAGTP